MHPVLRIALRLLVVNTSMVSNVETHLPLSGDLFLRRLPAVVVAEVVLHRTL